jgi:hypothetical protein
MKDSVSATLGQLVSVSDSLNKASDFLSTRISEVESALARYKLGITAWVEIDRQDVDAGGGGYSYTRIRQLGYGKNNGKWGLLVSEFYDEDPDASWHESFLREASRDVRLSAVDKLPDLLKRLVQKATEVANDATLKAETARQIAAGLTQLSPE